MTFAIFVLRADPDFAIFDVEVGNPPVGKRDEYDCAGVLRGGSLAACRRWIKTNLVNTWCVSRRRVS